MHERYLKIVIVSISAMCVCRNTKKNANVCAMKSLTQPLNFLELFLRYFNCCGRARADDHIRKQLICNSS